MQQVEPYPSQPDSVTEPEPTQRLTKINCRHCGKPTVWQDNPYRPFCSERCKLIDLGAWADEAYRLPDPTPLDDLDY